MRGYSAYLSMSMSANTQYYTSCTHVLASAVRICTIVRLYLPSNYITG
jgi:hypothetical protein